MKDLKNIRRFNKSNERLNIFDGKDSDNLDLPMELEYKLRIIDENSPLTVDNFLEECGIDLNTMSGFAWASILKQKKERFNEMEDDKFFNLYKEYKSKL